MNEQERQEIKSALIELGYWKAEEEGDPTTHERAVGVLLPRIERRLPAGLFLYTDLIGELLMTHDVRVMGKGIDWPLATSNDLPTAICLAALALPEFLKQHQDRVAERRRPVSEAKAMGVEAGAGKELAREAMKPIVYEERLSRHFRGNETTLKQRPNVFNELEERERDNEANTTGIPGGPEEIPYATNQEAQVGMKAGLDAMRVECRGREDYWNAPEWRLNQVIKRQEEERERWLEEHNRELTDKFFIALRERAPVLFTGKTVSIPLLKKHSQTIKEIALSMECSPNHLRFIDWPVKISKDALRYFDSWVFDFKDEYQGPEYLLPEPRSFDEIYQEMYGGENGFLRIDAVRSPRKDD